MACLSSALLPDSHIRVSSVVGRGGSVVGRDGAATVAAQEKCVGFVALGKGKCGTPPQKLNRSGGRRQVPRTSFLGGPNHELLLRRNLEVVLVAKTEVFVSLNMDAKKITTGAGGATLEDVPHLTDWLPDLPTYSNPLKHNPAYSAVRQYFVEDTDVVAKDVVVNINTVGDGVHFRRAGPRDKIYFKAEDVRACIVTCGGLCPGINTVIREIVCGLWTQYGVRDILGIIGGYRGFYSQNTVDLNPKTVGDIHKRGGTVLKSSRGGSDIMKIVDSIQDRGINQVYIIGGDGTQKGANAIHAECRKRGLQVVVAGIPKTIDNDIDVIDKSFGFDTAVEEAQRAINAAHVEAESVNNGIGLVKLMGRYSGYIAMHATLASRDVDVCLIPEVPFYLKGPGGLLDFVRSRLRESGHMVIVVAEGAGQELIAESMGSLDKLSDASGNKLLLDVGLWLCQNLKEHFLKEFKEPLILKYIDPTYMIRAIPSNASDNVYCTLLAHSAIHGAMAGYCGFTVGPVNNRHCYIPISRVVETTRGVNVQDRMWARLMSSTNQPNFTRYARAIQLKRMENAAKQGGGPDLSSKTPKSPSTNGSSKIDANGDGREPVKAIETSDRQVMPDGSEETNLLTTTVPGDPTASKDYQAP